MWLIIPILSLWHRSRAYNPIIHRSVSLKIVICTIQQLTGWLTVPFRRGKPGFLSHCIANRVWGLSERQSMVFEPKFVWKTKSNWKRTCWWAEEVEEGVALHRLLDGPCCAASLVLLLLLDSLHRDVLALLPVDLTPAKPHTKLVKLMFL